MKSNYKLKYKGREYFAYELAKIAGVSPSTFSYRLKTRKSVEEAMKPLIHKSEKYYWVNGKRHTIKQLSAIYKIKVETIRSRLFLGFDIEKAVKEPVQDWKNGHKKEVKENGK